jgi:hypothetical protein
MAMGEITTIKVFMNSLELETWTIIKVGDRYSVSYYVQEATGITTYQIHPLKISKWKLIRYFQLKILRKTL